MRVSQVLENFSRYLLFFKASRAREIPSFLFGDKRRREKKRVIIVSFFHYHILGLFLFFIFFFLLLSIFLFYFLGFCIPLFGLFSMYMEFVESLACYSFISCYDGLLLP